jgi:hypothetical protein
MLITAIRKIQIPQYLFRAFTSENGGGQHLAVNNETEIVPHGMMDGTKLDTSTVSRKLNPIRWLMAIFIVALARNGIHILGYKPTCCIVLCYLPGAGK